ncbi:MAG: hypothetical protein CMM67_11790 [Rhodospirillaceae bacterium]|nr:hypothetical protein [Rhodospirillaceae bacterium]OUT76237.1 MAG: hypothetical protein CBB83_11970 [Rhodospirillaceae bacterium TMED23]|tara:strand:- start:59576 stop:60484 length:909 start_codon:yes stop_codon:yes gene_type:complete
MENIPQSPNQSFDLTMSDGAIIRIRRYGNTDGVRLFLTHGNGFAIDGYYPYWKLLIERFDLIVFDMRNHGINPFSGADGHHYAQLSNDIGSIYHGVTNELGHKTSVGVFHSFSARAAMKHATQSEWCWDAMVLYDPPNVPLAGHPHYEPMCKFERRLVDWSMTRPNRFKNPQELAKNYTKGGKNWVDGAHELMARAVLRQNPGSEDWVLSCPRELEASIYLAAMTMDLWPQYKEYGGPVKLIGADPKLERGPATSRANQSLCEEYGYPYESIPETGHLLQIEKPTECVASMLTFLEAQGIEI